MVSRAYRQFVFAPIASALYTYAAYDSTGLTALLSIGGPYLSLFTYTARILQVVVAAPAGRRYATRGSSPCLERHLTNAG